MLVDPFVVKNVENSSKKITDERKGRNETSALLRVVRNGSDIAGRPNGVRITVRRVAEGLRNWRIMMRFARPGQHPNTE